MQDVVKKIIEIITANFSNGIRDDFIDTNRVLRIYSAKYGYENISRNFIIDVIRANGIENGGRFYFISESDVESITQFLDELLGKYPIIYYSAVYKRHSDFFVNLHIFSPEILKKLLSDDSKNFYFDEFCSASKMTRLDYEISKIFMKTNISLALEDLQKKLPYVPAEKILAVLSNTKKFLPTNTGKYFSISKIEFDREEIFAAKKKIFDDIAEKNFVAFEDFDLSSNFNLNPEIAGKNLRSVIYEKFLSADFTKRGKKIFKKGAVIKTKTSKSAIEILREFIATKNELSVEELFSFAKNLSTDIYVASLRAAYEKMIRVDKDLFVKDTLINFDIDGVDEALRPFVQGKIIPLRGVTSFTGFPPVEGYSWNLFMLESFLRKYSKKYVYDAPAPNSSSMGAIYPKSMQFENYLDVQASAVIQENIPLEKFAVEEFLVAQGYRANRIDKITNRIINKAQEFLNL